MPPIDENRSHGADDQSDLLLRRRRADQKSGFQILRSAAGIGGGDADHAANREGQHGVASAASSPASRNMAQVAISVAMAMPLIGFDEVPISPRDARRDRGEQKSEDHHENGREQIGEEAGLRAGNGPKRQQRPHHDRYGQRAETTNFMGRSCSMRLATRAPAFAAGLHLL